MKVVGIIPARYGSTRFPGKPLKLIAGRPLLSWVIKGAKESKLIDEIHVATDHEEILKLSESEGVKGCMTPSDLPSGTDRVWHVAKNLDADVVINIQGDEPLIKGGLLDELVSVFKSSPQPEMATLARSFQSVEDFMSKNTAKIVLNQKDQAIYFSRLPIPHSREGESLKFSGALKHIGLYGFTKDFLKRFCNQAPTSLERDEGLEQLRALYLGAKIQVVKVDYESWGVDTPEDIQRVEEKLKS